jgi:hypothetical protein
MSLNEPSLFHRPSKIRPPSPMANLLNIDTTKKYPGLSIHKNFGQIHERGIHALAASENYLYTSDQTGAFRRYFITNPSSVRDYGKIEYSSSITSMVTTKDDRFIFVSFGYGSLRKYSIKEQILKHDYGKILPESTIKGMVAT